MIVEFIGSTGAGKTTLISKVGQRLAGSRPVTTPFNLVADRAGLGHISHPTIRNLFQEIVGFPYFVAALPRHGGFVAFMLRMLARQARLSVFTLNNLRSLERKIGMYEFATRFGSGRIVLVDEGTVLSAHNVFVYSDTPYTDEEVLAFAGLVPLPDIIVYIKAPVEVLVKRSLQRSDPPRELRSRDALAIRRHVTRAAQLFEMLAGAERVTSRMLIVDNPTSDKQDGESTVTRIVDFILHAASAETTDEMQAHSDLPKA